MSGYPKLTRIKTNDFELKTIKKMDMIEKQKKFENQYNHFEIILDEFKKDKVKYKKKASKNQKQQIFNKFVGILSGASTLSGVLLTSTVLSSIAGIPISVASFVLTIASIIFNSYLDSIKIRNRKLQDYVNITILLDEKTLKRALHNNVKDEKEQKYLKVIYQYYLDEKGNIKNQHNSMLIKYLKIV